MCNCLLNLFCPRQAYQNFAPVNTNGCGCNRPRNCDCNHRHCCGCCSCCNNYVNNGALLASYGASTVNYEPEPTTLPYVYQYDATPLNGNFNTYNGCCGGCNNQRSTSNLSMMNCLNY